MFWRKNKNLKSEEFEDLIKRIGSLRADVEELKSKVEKFEVRFTTLKKKEKLESNNIDINDLEGQKEQIENYLRSQGFV